MLAMNDPPLMLKFLVSVTQLCVAKCEVSELPFLIKALDGYHETHDRGVLLFSNLQFRTLDKCASAPSFQMKTSVCKSIERQHHNI